MKDEILAGIQQNMRIESVRGEAQPDAPYGPGPKAALEDALELGRKLGFKVGQADNRIGWVEYGEGKEMVGVLGHVDVVPAGDTGWTYLPMVPRSTMEFFGEEDVWMIRDRSLDQFTH